MLLSFVIVGVLVVQGGFNGINSGLPKYIPEQNFGLIDILYRLNKIVGAALLMYPLTLFTWHWPTILGSIFCYFIAFVVKRLTRCLAYKDYL